MNYTNTGPYYQPYYQPGYMQNQNQAQNSGIIWVQGLEAAKSFMVGAGNSVLLMDADANCFYIKSTDTSGMPLPIRVFDYTERATRPQTAAQAQNCFDGEFVTRKEFEALAARLDAITANTAERGGQDEPIV